MTDTFDIRTLPAGTIIRADDAWCSFQAHRHHISHDPIIRDGSGAMKMCKLPSQFVVVLGLLDGNNGFDGLTVAPFGWGNNGPQRGHEQFAMRQRTPDTDEFNDGYVEVDRSMVVGLVQNVATLPVFVPDMAAVQA